MGLNLAYLPFFDVCHSVIPLRGVMKVLGSQTMHDPEEELIRYARKMGYARFEKEPSVRNLFLERYGISDYTDYDINDSADVKIDFGAPIPESLHNSCDVLLNAGTLEHIFNISCAVKNMHDMLRPGGVLINIVPYSWHNHAYYNINPCLFYSIDAANGYERIAEGFHYPADGKKRGFLFGKRDSLAGLLLVRIKENYTEKALEVHKNLESGVHKSNILCFYASQKIHDAEFKIPYDIQA